MSLYFEGEDSNSLTVNQDCYQMLIFTHFLDGGKKFFIPEALYFGAK
jgi:hypothetical protein